MKYCKKCVLPDSRPGIELNANGVCSACIGAQEKRDLIDWERRERALVEILKENKVGNGQYDCIVPVSGGKDSTWQAYTLKNKYALKPLALTYKCKYRTPLGQKNLDNLINIGVDHIDFTVSPAIERKFMLKSLEKNGSVSLVEHMAMWAITLKMAVKLGIKLVVWGENPGLEYGGNEKDRGNPYLNHDWIKKYGVTNGTFAADWADADLTLDELYTFTLPTEAELSDARIKSIFLGWYLRWDPLEVAEFSRNIGFQWADKPVFGYYPYADLDCDFIVIHHFFKWYKFGITRLWDNLAVEIRNNRLTREEAVNYIKNNPEPIPELQIKNLCSFLNITEERFWQIAESHRNPDIWRRGQDGPQKGQWYLPALVEEFGFWPGTYAADVK
ncbi:MAG: N-acetyl sugar amidotransferase [Nitrospirae bacterium]|nr:N-acetyl sugar amidotransferase [Nitrospirota bacterium]